MATDKSVLVRCANCAWNFNTQKFGRINCPNCRAEIWLDLPEGLDQKQPVHDAPSTEHDAPDQPAASKSSYTEKIITKDHDADKTSEQQQKPPNNEPIVASFLPAWETNRGNTIGRFTDTIKQVMLNPIKFFADLQPNGYRKPLGFGLIIGTIAVVSFALYGMMQLDRAETSLVQSDVQSYEPAESTDQKAVIESLRGFLLLSLYTAPFLGLFNLLVSSLLYHLGVILLTTQHYNYTATFRATAYSTAPLVLGAIPFVGYLLGGLWSLAIQIIAIAQIHRMGLSRAVVVVLWPITMVLLLLNALY